MPMDVSMEEKIHCIFFCYKYTSKLIYTRMDRTMFNSISSESDVDSYLRHNNCISELLNVASHKNEYITLDILKKYYISYHPSGTIKGLVIRTKMIESIVLSLCPESYLIQLIECGHIDAQDIFLYKQPQGVSSEFTEYIFDRYDNQEVWKAYYMNIV
jgi:hypothetical protein